MDASDLEDERAEELITLQSIYPELDIDPTDPFAAQIELPVTPAMPFSVVFEPEQDVRKLPYLPPLQVAISLGSEYPTVAPPSIKLSTTPPWLPDNTIRDLVKQARTLWEEYGGGPILFAYISYLQESAETAFGMADLVLPTVMKAALEAYSERMKRELFDNETFDCEVCLEPKKGSACYRMERCGHVFCVACLKDYYNSCINEGDVNNVKCMAAECGMSAAKRKKKNRLLSPKELLRIPLSLDIVERYAKLKRKKKIEADPSIIYCPRSWCQGPMRTEKYPKITNVHNIDESDSEDEEPPNAVEEVKENGPERRRVGVSGMDRLAVCEDCNLAFCKICLASWHGDFERCEPRDQSQLTEEDQASLNFILRNTSPCPTCAVPCQKSHGCNHMTCFQCKTHFCYLCGAWLNPDHPYAHFNDKKNKGCYQRLMEMAEGDMAEGDNQFGGRRGAERLAEFYEQEAVRIQMELDAEVGVN